MFGPVLMGVVIAVRAIRRNPLRSTLTTLGLLVGIAAVVTVTGIASAARQIIGDRIESIGSNVIIISPKAITTSGARGAGLTPGRLTEEDARAISREASSVGAVAPLLFTRAVLVSGERSVTTTVIGTTTAFLTIRNFKIRRGENWSSTDEVTKAKVCVIGATVARQLFGTEDPVGRLVRLGHYPYRIVGVLEARGETPLGGGDQDDTVLVPIGSMRLRLSHARAGAVNMIFASAVSAPASHRAESQIKAILLQRHKKQGRPADFTIFTQERILQVQALVFNALTGFLVCIAAISLLVGGIGVMNIMLVSVTERTREIGIRMAIGARESDVRTQFLVEAVTLCLLGGILGVLAGGLSLTVLVTVLKWPLQFNGTALLAGIAMSTATGIVFGFVPARRAARLDTIEALRHE